ncbi:MAG: helix-turn-helix transcriptional regulator [Leptospiraceae bacterium]|nr:helix-turn-helix transcriptional regulator [Leptospiraceae bacterium]MCP5501101.1 helix-turn-helix transcriptional regulator [Leptospiraceae bacterium]
MKLSVYKLEEQTGVSKTHIHRILKGSGKVSLKYYIKIAKILDIKYCFTNVEQIFSEFFKPDEYEIIDSNKKTTKERKKKNEQ